MNTSPSPCSPDLQETREFLENLPRANAEHLAVIEDGRGLAAQSFERGNMASAVAWLAQFQGVKNCYYHPNQLREGVIHRKARREDVAASRLLHVDIDDLDALPRISAFGVPPSVVIMSGGGYQCLWFLAEPLDDLDRVEALNKAIAEVLGGDNCHSADHLMRLPGTLNVPNAKKRAKGRSTTLATIVRPMTDYQRKYKIEEIEEALCPRPNNQLAPLATTSIGADTLPVAISDYVKGLIRHGDDIEKPIGTTYASYPSRSEVVFRVACELATAGASEEVIVGVLTNPANGISESILERRKSDGYAARQARQAWRIIGEGWPDEGKGRQPRPTFANALVALTRLGLTFEYDAFQNRRRVNGHLLQELTGELSDDICALIRNEVLRRWRFDPGKEHVRDAAQTLAAENTRHPVREYLDGLRWDGVARVSSWLTGYLGADDNPLHRAMGELVLMAAVRRVRQPGAKFDAILVLEGPQGSGKSTALNVLASDAYFSDQDILTLDPKAQMETIEGVWIYELGELQGLNRAETDKVKAFASRRVDRGRPAYARFREDRPRQTIFIGTTNDDQYLRDPTGNRRFWPVKTGKIDLAGLDRDRDQLWAEAAQLEAEGRSLSLPEELWATAAQAQEARLMDEPWADILSEIIGDIEGERERISTQDLLGRLEVPPERQTQFQLKRLGAVMRKLGWSGPKSFRIGGKVRRGYERHRPGEPDDVRPTY